MSGFLTGLLKGVGDTARAGRAEAAKAQEDQFAREQKVLEELAQSADEEVAGAATTALIQHASGVKRPKGGWLAQLTGPPEASIDPAVAKVVQLAKSPRVIPGQTVTVFDGQGGGAPTVPTPLAPARTGPRTFGPPEDTAAPLPPPGPAASQLPTGASAAMAPPPGQGPAPSFANVPPPPPPPASILVGRTPPILMGGHDVTGPPTEIPRHLFLTPEEKITADARAKASGTLKGDYEGLIAAGHTPQRAAELVGLKYGGSSATVPRFFGNVLGSALPDGTLDDAGRPVTPTQMYRHVQVGGQDLFTPVSSATADKPVYRQGVLLPGAKGPALVQVFPDGSTKFIAWQAERDFPLTINHDDGSQEVIQVPAAYSNRGGAVGGPPPVAPTAATPHAPAGPPVSRGTTAPQGGGPPAAPPVAGTPSARSLGGIQTKPEQFKPVHVRLPSGLIRQALQRPNGAYVTNDASHTPIPEGSEVTSADAQKWQGDVDNLTKVEAGLNTVEGLIKKVLPPGSGFLGGVQAGLATAAAGVTKNKDLAALQTELNLLQGPVARVIETLSGRIPVQLIQQAKESLAAISANPLTALSQEAALEKLLTIRRALADARDVLGIGKGMTTTGSRFQLKEDTGGPPAPPPVAGRGGRGGES